VWQALYDSPWHHPAVAWLAVTLGAVALAARQRFLVGYLMLFGLEMAADALASAPFTHLPSGAATVLAVVFVIAGDFRLFLLVERCVSQDRLTWGGALRALGLSLIVPVGSSAIRLLVPAVSATGRLQYLVYEGLFVVLALAMRFVVLPRRLADREPETRRWALDLTAFVLVQYVLWVLADLLLLGGFAPAYALRIVPNVMYYALFLPFVYVRAPARERAVTNG
jgi:hypothetical protein